MRQLFALFHKEYRETRSATLVFLAIGALVPILIGLAEWGSIHTWLFYHLGGGAVALGGLAAMWLNLTILCATSFTRERESGTMETLRRAAPSWRLAALGKFGYAILSTLALGAFFFLLTLGADLLSNKSLTSSALAVFATDERYVIGQACAAFNLWQAAFWGVFWTGRLARQTSAILLSVVCAMSAGLAATNVMSAFDLMEGPLPLLIVEFAVAFLLLCFAPGKNRFGYKSDPNALAETFESNEEPARDPQSLAQEWDNVKQKRPAGSFAALFGAQLAEGALLFRSPASILYELAIVTILGASVLFVETRIPNLLFFGVNALLCAVYFLLFASGLFQGACEDRSIVKERFDVGPKKYWFAGFAAAILVFGAAAAIFTFNVKLNNAIQALEPLFRSVLISVAIVMFGVGAWIGTLRLGRLVKGALGVLLTIASCFLFPSLMSIAGWLGFELASDALLASKTLLLAFSILLSLAFLLGSYRRATRAMNYKSAKIAAAFPLVLLFGALALGAYCVNAPGTSDSGALAYAPKRASFDESKIPANEEEYRARVEAAQKEIESYERVMLVDPEEAKPAGTVLLMYPTVSPEDLQTSVDDLIRAFELTKRGAAPLRAAAIAEERFYNLLLTKGLPGGSIPKAIALLNSIPDRRPTLDELADNECAAAIFGPLDASALSFEETNALKQLRKDRPRVLRDAAINVCQLHPSLIEKQLGKSKSENDLIDLYLESVGSSDEPFYQATETLVRSAEKNVAELERTRRFLIPVLAQRVTFGYHPLDMASLLKLGELKEAPKLMSEESPDPLFSTFAYGKSFGVPSNHSPQRLKDKDGTPLQTPDGRDAYVANAFARVDVRGMDPEDPKRSINEPVVMTAQGVFDKNGKQLVSTKGESFVSVEYQYLANDGTPRALAPFLSRVKPPFPCDDAMTSYDANRQANQYNRPIVSQVCAFNPLEQEVQNVTPIEGVWMVQEFFGHELGKYQGMTEAEMIEAFIKDKNELRSKMGAQNAGSGAMEGKTLEQIEYEQGRMPKTRYVDSEGKEILDESGKPKYGTILGVFADPSSVTVPGYDQAIPLPTSAANRSDKLQVVYQAKVGEYKPLPESYYRVVGSRVFLKMQCAIAAAYADAKALGLAQDSNDEPTPVLVVELKNRLNMADLR